MPYAAIHEFGGQIPDRYPVNGKALKMQIGGETIFRTFARGFTMPERSYMRSALSDYRQKIVDDLSNAIGEAINA